MMDSLFVLGQHLAPQHLISRGAGLIANSTNPRIRDPFIHWFIRRYGVDMSEAQEPDPAAYRSFNQFFTRALKPGARPLEGDESTLVSPADGAISQLGSIRRGRIFQAKGQSFTLSELTAEPDRELAEFEGGAFNTIYLSPRDYHRVHMPVTGTLERMTFIPGRLFSVNPVTAERVPRLFARNERVVAWFRTEYGPMAVVLVGAMIVASIETVWAGPVAPSGNRLTRQDYPVKGDGAVTLSRGEEMGRFALGSTVVVALPRGRVEWDTNLDAATPLSLGQSLGQLSP